KSLSAPAVASAPLTNARLRPCDVISRRTTSSSPSLSKIASIDAASSPLRTRSPDARPPSNRPTASTKIDLPAPVSPVRTLKPGSNSTSAASMMAKWEIFRKRSIAKGENSNHTIGLTAIQAVCYSVHIALSQRRTAMYRRPVCARLERCPRPCCCRRQAACRSLGDSPLVGLFQSGYTELTAQLRQNAPAEGAAAAPGSNPRAPAGRPTIKSLTAMDRALMRASVVEVNKLERRIPFLATTASIAPFIGLFGTVWG